MPKHNRILPQLSALALPLLALAAASLPRRMDVARANLEEQLLELAETTGMRYGLKVTLVAEGRCLLPDSIREGLLRIVREAIQNVGEHARTDELTLRLLSTSIDRVDGKANHHRSVLLSIIDHGCGFDVQAARQKSHGLGEMQSWANHIGATLFIDSYPGEGTQVTVLWEQFQGLEDAAVQGV